MAKKTPEQLDLTGNEVAGYVKPKYRSKRERYREFAENYMNVADPETYFNATKSALKAGYSPGYVRGNAYKLVAKRGIAEEIEAIKLEKRGNPNILTTDEVLETLTTQIRILANQLIDKDSGEFIPIDKLDSRTAQAIAGFEVIERILMGDGENAVLERKTKYKLVDRLRALEMLGRYWGIFEKDNKSKTPTVPVALVAFPAAPMTLVEWQEQAQAILKANDAAKAAGG
jgi:phage terminase small subunit